MQRQKINVVNNNNLNQITNFVYKPVQNVDTQIHRPVKYVQQRMIPQYQQGNAPISKQVIQTSNENITQTKKQIVPKYKTMKPEDIITTSYNILKQLYKTHIERISIDSVVHGEVITTNPKNIFVNKNIQYEDDKWDLKCKLINKKLYDYQEQSIKKIRELELNPEYTCDATGEHVHSNGWLLHLPIGSGKTLVFTFLAIMYRTIPKNPIIISTSGINIPDNIRIQLKYYPFYYENVGYIEGKENAVVVLKDYVQRSITVIITHSHLMDQLRFYINSDFNPKIFKNTKFCFANMPSQINLNCDILVVPADIMMINRLVKLSYEAPFMRIIVDDFTNMTDVEEYRQILATSTLFVSGSGFERDKNKIPPSYYTLRHIDVEKFSLVSDVNDTKKGIERDTIATFNLIGSNTDFSTYKFISDVEDSCANKFQLNPGVVYNPIEDNGNLLKDWFSLMFIFKNMNKLSYVIGMIEKDIQTGKLSKDRVPNYLKWKESIKRMIKIYGKDGKTSKEVKNPLLELLYSNTTSGNQNVQTLVQQQCSICNKLVESSNDYGFISTCCGSFFCADCTKAMATNKLINSNNQPIQLKPDSYYCTICHKHNPTYFINSTRNKRNNLPSWHLIEDYMDIEKNINAKCIHTDLYFKMFNEGLKPKYVNGRKIKVQIDNKVGDLDDRVIQLFSKDRLTMGLIGCLDNVLKQLEIRPGDMNEIKPTLLFYDCPTFLHQRIKQYFETNFSKNKDSNLYKLDVTFKKDMGELIGLHNNILGIIVWKEPENIDEIHQLIGRILRLNTWNNPLYFYITCKSIDGCENNIIKQPSIEKVKDFGNEDNINNEDPHEVSDGELMQDNLDDVIRITRQKIVETEKQREERIESEAIEAMKNSIANKLTMNTNSNTNVNDVVNNINAIGENSNNDIEEDTEIDDIINAISNPNVETNVNEEQKINKETNYDDKF